MQTVLAYLHHFRYLSIGLLFGALVPLPFVQPTAYTWGWISFCALVCISCWLAVFPLLYVGRSDE